MPIRSARKRPTHRPAQHRPRSVSFVGWLVLLQGLGFLGAGAMRIVVARWGDLGYSLLKPLTSHGPAYLFTAGGAWIALGLLALMSALALWRMHTWAWAAAMLVQLLSLGLALISYLRGSSNYPAMVFGVVIVFILNNQEVQDAFHR